MTIRLSGMSSGMDTDALVKGMLDAQRLKNKKVTDKQSLLTWQQDKWKELNTKLYKLYTEDLSKMRLQGNYQAKKVTSSNESLATVTSNTSAPEGAHTLTIDKLASSQYVTGAKITAKANTKLNALGIASETLINISSGGTTKTLEVTSSTTIADFVNKAKAVGLNASFDEKQGRFFISSKESGVKGSFEITATTSTATTPKNQILDSIDYSTLSADDKKDADAAMAVLKSDISVAEDITTAKNTLNAFAQEKVLKQIASDINSEIMAEVTPGAILDEQTNIRAEVMQEQLMLLKEEAIKNGATQEELAAIIEANLTEGQKTNITTLQDDKIATSTTRINTAVATKVAEAIATEKAIEPTNRYTQAIIDRNSEIQTAATAFGDLTTSYRTNSLLPSSLVNDRLSKLGLDALNADGTKVTESSLSTVVRASDSEITYNGAKLTASSNIINANGLTITLKGKTGIGETVNLSVTNNTQANYDMVKKFIGSYNDNLKELNTLYYADSSKGYAPLSDDERAAMTDDQVEKWETKIKNSILRRDTTLGTLTESMKAAMSTAIEVDGKKYALSNYGIQTSYDYSEKGLLHIKGNADDATYSADDDKLMKALEEDPDTVMEVLTGISNKLFDTMSEKMKSIPNVSSALTFYNDKTMVKQQTDYAKQISVLEEKLVDMESKYYKQFAAMETAMSKLQSQSNALAGMLGTSNS